LIATPSQRYNSTAKLNASVRAPLSAFSKNEMNAAIIGLIGMAFAPNNLRKNSNWNLSIN
jgi:hypothetical protein